MKMEVLFERYRRISLRLPTKLRWLALVFAPALTSLTVFISGLMMVGAGLTITVAVNRISSGETIAPGMMWILIAAFLVQSLGYLVKERQELLLVVTVRQLTYRRFRSIFNNSSPASNVRGHALTYPGQVSQFAYVVDAVVAIVQVLAFLVASIVMYGMAGVLSALLIVAVTALSLRLISMIGELWEQYIVLEGERRSWIQRIAEESPRGRFIPSWASAVKRVTDIRHAEEKLLRKRVVLQIFNGFIDRGALTVILVAAAVISALLWPRTDFGIGIILAARYLYGAVQNLLANYRVIRLAVPMMRELDSLEKLKTAADRPIADAECSTGTVEVIASESARAKVLREIAPSPGAAYIPVNPLISGPVLEAWRVHSRPERLSNFNNFAALMGLSNDVIQRFWCDSSTLSSGERHRAALALVMSDNPEWIILDDTFAALDPSMREVVAKVLLSNVKRCSLLTSSEEYVPNAFIYGKDREILTEAASTQTPLTDNGNLESTQAIPDPLPRRASFRRSVTFLFGVNVVWILLGALLLVGSDVALALIIADNDHLSSLVLLLIAMCGAGTILGSLSFFGPLYSVPISKLTKLHERIIAQIGMFASPQTGGTVVGRLGEDFSELQMSVPGALGSVFIVLIQAALLILGATAGAPVFILIVLAVIPLAFLAMRQGAKWILPAATAAANRRGDFLAAVGAQAGLHTVPSSEHLREAGDIAYEGCERLYLAASVGQANAYFLRSVLLQSLTLLLNISALVLVAIFGNSHSLVAPVAVIFFATTLSSGIESTVETIQEVGVLGLTAERVRLLEDCEIDRTYPPAHTQGLQKVKDALASGQSVVALIGATGAGKSVILESLCRELPYGEVALIPDVDPFAGGEDVTSGLALFHAEVNSGGAWLILLDETFKRLTPYEERVELKTIGERLKENDKQAVVVLHSRSNLDCFTKVIDLNG